MTYKVVITKNALKDIRKLDRVKKKRIRSKIENYSKSPIKYARKLTDPRIGFYRWRIGNHRVIFDLEKDTIVILRIRHRREVYK